MVPPTAGVFVCSTQYTLLIRTHNYAHDTEPIVCATCEAQRTVKHSVLLAVVDTLCRLLAIQSLLCAIPAVRSNRTVREKQQNSKREETELITYSKALISRPALYATQDFMCRISEQVN